MANEPGRALSFAGRATLLTVDDWCPDSARLGGGSGAAPCGRPSLRQAPCLACGWPVHTSWPEPSPGPPRRGTNHLTARAAVRERREAFAEARRCERRLERAARFCGLAPVQGALASEQCISLGVEPLAHQAELVLARFEP